MSRTDIPAVGDGDWSQHRLKVLEDIRRLDKAIASATKTSNELVTDMKLINQSFQQLQGSINAMIGENSDMDKRVRNLEQRSERQTARVAALGTVTAFLVTVVVKLTEVWFGF